MSAAAIPIVKRFKADFMSTLLFPSVARLSTSEVHDFIRRHRNRPAPTHVLDQTPPPGAFAACLSNLDRGPFNLELHFRLRDQSKLLPNVLRNGYLPFAGNPHGAPFLLLPVRETPSWRTGRPLAVMGNSR